MVVLLVMDDLVIYSTVCKHNITLARPVNY